MWPAGLCSAFCSAHLSGECRTHDTDRRYGQTDVQQELLQSALKSGLLCISVKRRIRQNRAGGTDAAFSENPQKQIRKPIWPAEPCMALCSTHLSEECRTHGTDCRYGQTDVQQELPQSALESGLFCISVKRRIRQNRAGGTDAAFSENPRKQICRPIWPVGLCRALCSAHLSEECRTHDTDRR
jgi:hypothetical protein